MGTLETMSGKVFRFADQDDSPSPSDDDGFHP